MLTVSLASRCQQHVCATTHSHLSNFSVMSELLTHTHTRTRACCYCLLTCRHLSVSRPVCSPAFLCRLSASTAAILSLTGCLRSLHLGRFFVSPVSCLAKCGVRGFGCCCWVFACLGQVAGGDPNCCRGTTVAVKLGQSSTCVSVCPPNRVMCLANRKQTCLR